MTSDFAPPQFSAAQLQHQREVEASIEAMHRNHRRDEKQFAEFAFAVAKIFATPLADVVASPVARSCCAELAFAMTHLREQAERRAREPR